MTDQRNARQKTKQSPTSSLRTANLTRASSARSRRSASATRSRPSTSSWQCSRSSFVPSSRHRRPRHRGRRRQPSRRHCHRYGRLPAEPPSSPLQVSQGGGFQGLSHRGTQQGVLGELEAPLRCTSRDPGYTPLGEPQPSVPGIHGLPTDQCREAKAPWGRGCGNAFGGTQWLRPGR